jgi:hypothetical protein
MRRVALICVVLSTFEVTAYAQKWEFQGAFQTYFPNNNIWDSQAFGGEVKAIYWWDTTKKNKIGLAFSTGIVRYNVNDQIIEDTRVAGTGRTRALQGDVKYIPLGLSLLSRIVVPDHPRAKGIFEAGLHYMFCDSDMKGIQTLYLDDTLLDSDSLEMDCDNGLVGRIGIGLELALKRSEHPVTVFLNGGYQFDLDKGRAVENSWTNIRRDLELEAFFLKIGLAIPIH